MKTYKRGISLIVLVITIIILAILASVVIINLSNTNIIAESGNTVFKSDMSNYKSAYSLYLGNRLMEDSSFDSTTINVTSSDAEFIKIFGNNVKEEHKENLQIINGELKYKTSDNEKKEILKDLGMSVTTIIPLSEIKVGDLVDYTPTAAPDSTNSGITYVKDTDTASSKYNTYIEKTIDTYKPGNLTWVYLGQNEEGNILLTSQEATSFTVNIAGQDGWATGAERIDELCNTLYGNSKYAQETRNMKIEDVNRILGFNGKKGIYYDINGEEITTDEPKKFGEIGATGIALRASETEFNNYVSDSYSYTGTAYKANTTDEYQVIFKKSDGVTNQVSYYLSSSSALSIVSDGSEHYYLRYVSYGSVGNGSVCSANSDDVINEVELSYALRPVIVLKSNVQFGEKNSNDKLTLIET